jgi:nitrite reductase/ring-hydroxylating ferredoxin subunit/uncharacterized membrane protein
MSVEFPADVIEHQEWLDPVENGLQKAVTTVYESSGAFGRKAKNFLHGVWLGHPLHPVLTDIPVGSWTAGLILDIMDASGVRGCARGADAALKVGLAGAAGAAITGLTDWQAIDGAARRIGVTHGLLNVTATGLYTASLIARNRKNRPAGRTLAFIGFAVAAASAWLGGHLVFSKQIGVNHSAGEPLPEDWTPVLDDIELGEGEPRRVMASGVKTLLLRRAGQIYALAEVCSHLGGPLAEGQVQGATIQCPWHGSRFNMRDGKVIDGPATHPQPCFETRVLDGKIEVRGRSNE